VILPFNYEELHALEAGARGLLAEAGQESSPVLAPPEARARVEALLPLLAGDLSLTTLEEVRGVQVAISAIVAFLRAEMDVAVTATHPADEGAVAAYFDYAHAISVSHRLDRIAAEMEALIELMTGAPASDRAAREVLFPD